MLIRLGDTIRFSFGTVDGTGAAANADSPPVVVVLNQGTALGYVPAVGNKATGLYEVAIVASTGNGFVEGHEYSAYVTKVVSGLTKRDGIASFIVRTNDATTVLTRLGAPTGASVSEDILDIKSDTALLPGAVPKIDALHQIGVGRWKIQGTQLLIYDSDGTTLLLAFNLKDDIGQPSSTKVFERVPT